MTGQVSEDVLRAEVDPILMSPRVPAVLRAARRGMGDATCGSGNLRAAAATVGCLLALCSTPPASVAYSSSSVTSEDVGGAWPW